jgi:hypothetical protein
VSDPNTRAERLAFEMARKAATGRFHGGPNGSLNAVLTYAALLVEAEAGLNTSAHRVLDDGRRCWCMDVSSREACRPAFKHYGFCDTLSGLFARLRALMPEEEK